MLKKILSIAAIINLSGCLGSIPVPMPTVWQCQFNYSDEQPPIWVCENTDTHVVEVRDLMDPRMKAAQAVGPDDYKKLMKRETDLDGYFRHHTCRSK